MLSITLTVLLYTLTSAMPLANIIKDERMYADDGSYTIYVETENNIKLRMNGVPIANGDGGIIMQGEFSYIAPDGTPIEVNYVADVNGYQPQSNSLPTLPELPIGIPVSISSQSAFSTKPIGDTVDIPIGLNYVALHTPVLNPEGLSDETQEVSHSSVPEMSVHEYGAPVDMTPTIETVLYNEETSTDETEISSILYSGIATEDVTEAFSSTIFPTQSPVWEIENVISFPESSELSVNFPKPSHFEGRKSGHHLGDRLTQSYGVADTHPAQHATTEATTTDQSLQTTEDGNSELESETEITSVMTEDANDLQMEGMFATKDSTWFRNCFF